MGFAAWPMHQHISMLVFSPLLRPALTSLSILKVLVIVTFGIGAFLQSSNARPRGDDWGSISLLMSKNSCSVSPFGVEEKYSFFIKCQKNKEKKAFVRERTTTSTDVILIFVIFKIAPGHRDTYCRLSALFLPIHPHTAKRQYHQCLLLQGQIVVTGL